MFKNRSEATEILPPLSLLDPFTRRREAIAIFQHSLDEIEKAQKRVYAALQGSVLDATTLSFVTSNAVIVDLINYGRAAPVIYQDDLARQWSKRGSFDKMLRELQKAWKGLVKIQKTPLREGKVGIIFVAIR